jgi:PIN domain nuclease of toxin-antitoxin system
MSYLFDTHTYLWLRGDPARLPGKVSQLIADITQQGLISIVTPCEIAIKTGAGKLRGAALLVNFEKREIAVGFSIANLTVAQAIRSGLLPRHHRNPFDRLLIAQALDLDIPILSNDSVLDLYGVQRIWD